MDCTYVYEGRWNKSVTAEVHMPDDDITQGGEGDDEQNTTEICRLINWVKFHPFVFSLLQNN